MPLQKILTSGAQMKSISSNMARGAGCGYLRNAKIPLCGTILPEKALDTLVRYDYAMAKWLINEKAMHSMPNPIGIL
jgi:hypothetical protein